MEATNKEFHQEGLFVKRGELSEEKCRVKERFLKFIFTVQEI